MAYGGVSCPRVSTRNSLRDVSVGLFLKKCIFFKSYYCCFRMQAVQNLGMAVVTMMAGRIVDDQGYLVLEVFFLAWLCRNSLKFDHLKLEKWLTLISLHFQSH